MVTLMPKQSFKVPIEAKCITPDIFADKSLEEISKLKVWEGNSEKSIGKLFKIEQVDMESEKTTIKIYGDVSKVRRIGANMSMGKIVVNGDAGMHLGEEMKGGTIIVNGYADSWVGGMMTNGTIEINGDVGDYVGGAYRGSAEGMKGGTIIVRGNAGNEIGCFMKKGVIKIFGNVGQFTGIYMKKGSIFVQGNSEGRTGAGMTGGKIVVCGHIPSILPVFSIDGIQGKIKMAGEEILGPFYKFIGDLTEDSNGKLYVLQTRNRHLIFYEKFLSIDT